MGTSGTERRVHFCRMHGAKASWSVPQTCGVISDHLSLPAVSNSTRFSQYVTTAGSCKATDDVLEQASCLDLT